MYQSPVSPFYLLPGKIRSELTPSPPHTVLCGLCLYLNSMHAYTPQDITALFYPNGSHLESPTHLPFPFCIEEFPLRSIFFLPEESPEISPCTKRLLVTFSVCWSIMCSIKVRKVWNCRWTLVHLWCLCFLEFLELFFIFWGSHLAIRLFESIFKCMATWIQERLSYFARCSYLYRIIRR